MIPLIFKRRKEKALATGSLCKKDMIKMHQKYGCSRKAEAPTHEAIFWILVVLSLAIGIILIVALFPYFDKMVKTLQFFYKLTQCLSSIDAFENCVKKVFTEIFT